MAHRKDIYSGMSMAAFQTYFFVYFFLGICLQRFPFILSQRARAEGASEALHVAVLERLAPKPF